MKESQSTWLWIACGILVVVLCCCALFGVIALSAFWSLDSPWTTRGPAAPAPSDFIAPPPRLPRSEPRIVITPTPAPAEPRQTTPPPLETPEIVGLSTEEQLILVRLPTRDLRNLALRLNPDLDDVPLIVNETEPNYPIGTVLDFWVTDVDKTEQFQIAAELRYRTDVVYMWVEQGASVSQSDLERAAYVFTEEIYPTNRRFFGSEWKPGVDNDPRLHILHARNLGNTVAGYYSSADQYSRLAQPFSNEKEMFYINLDTTRPNTSFYYGVLAHEFQHMIHWYQDRNEETWVNEGFSELAVELNGFSRGGADRAFTDRPATQLNTWPSEPGTGAPYYGAAYLFIRYFYDRFGEEMTRARVTTPLNGIAGFDAVLAEFNTGLTFDDVFADWVVANYLNDSNVAGGRFGYRDENIDPVHVVERHRRVPVEVTRHLPQYATDYIEIEDGGDVTVTFQGNAEISLVDTTAYSGQFAWWSHRGDDINTRLVQTFDLSDVQSATLEARMWWDIEVDYDYAYVMASTDGETWITLPSSQTTSANPTGNNLGHGFTGVSSGGIEPDWVLQRFDLTSFTGGEVTISFEYVTDDAVNRPGMLIDHVAIREIGYFSDFETDGGGWHAEGWIHTDNVLTQRWLVQVVEQEGSRVRLNRILVDETGHARFTLDDLGGRRRATLIISPLAPVTTEQAIYRYQFRSR